MKDHSSARRHFLIPDLQVRKDEPTDHIDWIAQAIVDYAPDVVIDIGDHWDMLSMSSYDKPGSKRMEGARYEEDIDAGNEAMERLSAPMDREIHRQRRNKHRWKPKRHFLFGNHENRVQRALDSEPKLTGCIGLHHMRTNGWKRHDFLENVWIDGIVYAHYFQSSHSSYAIGGSIDNRLSKIGESFVQGHQQGMLYGSKIFPSGKTRHGLVAGSCYLHREDYRGNQGQKHWRGVVVLNEVRNGDYCIMPLTLSYLCRRYEKLELIDYMRKKYKHNDWSHLA